MLTLNFQSNLTINHYKQPKESSQAADKYNKLRLIIKPAKTIHFINTVTKPLCTVKDRNIFFRYCYVCLSDTKLKSVRNDAYKHFIFNGKRPAYKVYARDQIEILRKDCLGDQVNAVNKAFDNFRMLDGHLIQVQPKIIKPIKPF